ncbi:MAG: hypothetical protein Q4G46_13300 [Propionibacteriaceae bacterium]|nr:hypothetical protein [Propionibacteriaceae bacterium]
MPTQHRPPAWSRPLERLRQFVAHTAPRWLALTWAVWSALTALAYVDAAPQQLEAPASILPLPLWAAWAIAALLLILGAVIPPQMPPRHHQIARWFRILGMSIVTALLVLWVEAFLGAGGRGWVSAKNYALMVCFGLATAFTMGREEGARVQ